MIKYIYTFFIGLLVAAFVGLGVAAFYSPPERPEFETESIERPSSEMPSDEEIHKQKEFDQKIEVYQEKQDAYSRNVSIITLVFAVLLLVVSLTFLKQIDLIADGLLLGGLFTLIYSIGWSFASGDKIFMFAVVAVGLATALALGWLKFIKPVQKA